MSDARPQNPPPNDEPQRTGFDRIRRIFAEAMERPADERPAFLDHACAGDADLRHEVDSLLHAARPTRTTGHIRTGGAARAIDAVAGPGAAAAAGAVIAQPTKFAAVPLTEKPGTIIGPYKLLEAIGEGGFGTVFLADQTAPVRRRVALKVIKLGMDTKQVVARFEAERQALALMDHPNIAKVFDAGATELTASGGGRPYFVMEYVKGDPITLFADAHRLTLRERLELFMQVCNAVQHAHQKGVIHRDIKPSNVLVSMVDGKPLAKVIDFGIAKATGAAGGTLTDKTLFTEHRALIGTPEYMSPEQAEGSPDIDTRTDVYGLGVLMYELLTGTTPFEPTRLRSAAHAEMQRIIKEEEPPSPSLRITRDVQRDLKQLATTAAQRKVEPQKLNALMRGELDWIVMKAIDKDRSRRFSTPQDLAADVDRHLRGEAVVAAPPSAAYRVRKFVRKNKGAVVTGTAVAAALLVGIAGTTWQWQRASQLVETAKEMLGSIVAQHAVREPGSSGVVHVVQDDSGSVVGNIRVDDVDISGKPLSPPQVSVLAADSYLDGVRGTAPSGLEVIRMLGQYASNRASELVTMNRELLAQTDAAEWSAYTANLALAQAAIDAGDYPEARKRLGYAPESKTGWEQTFLDRQADSALWQIKEVGPSLSSAAIAADSSYFVTASDGKTEPRVFVTQNRTFSLGFGQVDETILAAASSWPVLGLGGFSGETRSFIHTPLIGLRLAAMLASSPNGPIGLTLISPDGTRRIVGGGVGGDKTVRFYEAKDGKPTLPATTESLEGVFREVAVFRMPEAVTNLQMTGDGTRLIIHLADGSARVWDIRDPEERRKDLQAEWAERVPAGQYLDTLWASPTPNEQLRDAIINDASLTPLRRLVAAEMLEERLEDDRLAAEQAFAAISKDQTEVALVQAAAAAADLPARVKAQVMKKAAAWAYSAPEPSDAEKLAEETKQRRLAEASAMLARARFMFVESPEVPADALTLLSEGTNIREELLGHNDPATLRARWMLLGLSRLATRDAGIDELRTVVQLWRHTKEHAPELLSEREDIYTSARDVAASVMRDARALMAPAADGTPSPWANDDDAKDLLAEAEALINGPDNGPSAAPVPAPPKR
jgi:serine/threonine protein kinase